VRSASRISSPRAGSIAPEEAVRQHPVVKTGNGKGPAERAAYSAAGVDVAAGDRAVDLLRQVVAASRRRTEVIGGLGGFGAGFAVPAGYRDPVLVAATDGVGTKTEIAARMGRFDTIGIDLVAMCADDVVCSGAEPLFFLDYVALGRLEPNLVAELVGGIAAGCEAAGCALIGGETAEHPGLMAAGTFDLAGFCVGIVEREAYLDGTAARAGDVVLGLPSSGLHANGFSLVRAVLGRFDVPLDRPYREQLALSLGEPARDAALAEEPGLARAIVGEVFLAPTRIYAADILRARRALRDTGHDLGGLAHVTGGGLPGNLPRAVPEALGVRVDPTRWPIPSPIALVAALAGIDGPELRATFNGGIGMALVVPPEAVAVALAALPDALVIGEVVSAAELGARYAEGPLASAPATRR
jgi:phosphoribosylformylglycinamidine cyclo-ligase